MSFEQKNTYEQRFAKVMDYTNQIIESLILTKSNMEMSQNASINKIVLIQKMWDKELCSIILNKLKDNLKFINDFYQYSKKIKDVPHMHALVKERNLINTLINHIQPLHTNKFVYSAFIAFICECIKLKKAEKEFSENINLIAPLTPKTKIVDSKNNGNLIDI
jgi:hypothetical protein